MEILDVRIDAITKSEALNRVSNFLSGQKQHMIFTPNPEMLSAAHRDESLRKILNESSLNLCDGKGLELAAKLPSLRRRGEGEVSRTPGIDFMLEICHLAKEKGRSVYLLGSGDKTIVQAAVENLKKKFPRLKITGWHPGPRITYHVSHIKNQTSGVIEYDTNENDSAIDDIIMSAPDILFVAFGHGKQEKWIDEHLPQLPSVKIAMGVGGAFDVLGGRLKRAPLLLRRLALEWLWRLFQQPRRIRRIFNAIIVFTGLVLLEKIRTKK